MARPPPPDSLRTPEPPLAPHSLFPTWSRALCTLSSSLSKSRSAHSTPDAGTPSLSHPAAASSQCRYHQSAPPPFSPSAQIPDRPRQPPRVQSFFSGAAPTHFDACQNARNKSRARSLPPTPIPARSPRSRTGFSIHSPSIEIAAASFRVLDSTSHKTGCSYCIPPHTQPASPNLRVATPPAPAHPLTPMHIALDSRQPLS